MQLVCASFVLLDYLKQGGRGGVHGVNRAIRVKKA
jgi:hypothetical protein